VKRLCIGLLMRSHFQPSLMLRLAIISHAIITATANRSAATAGTATAAQFQSHFDNN
jgi:hypothetical protein